MKPYKYKCAVCHQPQVSLDQIRAVCPDCVTTGSRRLTNHQYLTWLRLAYARIGGGSLPLVFFDCTEEGNKELYCSWGMCNDDLAAWPWPDTWYNPEHTGFYGPLDKPQVKHISRKQSQLCPFDNPDTGLGYGCFRRCRIFNGEAIIKQYALKLILVLQEEYEGEKEVVDGH